MRTYHVPLICIAFEFLGQSDWPLTSERASESSVDVDVEQPVLHATRRPLITSSTALRPKSHYVHLSIRLRDVGDEPCPIRCPVSLIVAAPRQHIKVCSSHSTEDGNYHNTRFLSPPDYSFQNNR